MRFFSFLFLTLIFTSAFAETDIEKVFDDVFGRKAINQLAISVVSAGAAEGICQFAGFDPSQFVDGKFVPLDTIGHLKNVGIHTF